VVEQRTSGPRLARKPDPAPGGGAEEGQQEAADLEAEWHRAIAAKNEEIEEITTGTGKYLDLDRAEMPRVRSRATRELVILTAMQPASWDELDMIEQKAKTASETEAKTLEAIKGFGNRVTIADPLAQTYGFPEEWARRLEKSMRLPLDPVEMGRQREKAWTEFQASGAPLPGYLAAHGLPVDFDTAMDLRSFGFYSPRLPLPTGHPLRDFQLAGAAYTAAFADEQLAIRYAAAVQSLVADVRAGETKIDTTVWDQYAYERSWAPTPGDLLRQPPMVALAPEPDEVNPYTFEREAFGTLYLLRMVDALGSGGAIRAEFDRRLDEADQRIAALDPWIRLELAHGWASELGYGTYVREVLWKQFKDALSWDSAKDMVKDAAEFAAIQEIPIFNVAYDLYQVAKAIVSGAEALMDLDDARDAVMSAKGVVELQRATAHLTLAEHADVLKLAGSVLQAYGSWTAMRHAMRAHLPEPTTPAVEEPTAPTGEPTTPAAHPAPAPLPEPPVPRSAIFEGISPETEGMLANRPGLAKVLAEHPRAADLFKLCESPCFPSFLKDEEMVAALSRLERMEAEAAKAGVTFRRDAFKKLLHKQTTVGDVEKTLDEIESGLGQRIRASWQPVPEGEPPAALAGAATKMPPRTTPSAGPVQFEGAGNRPPAGYEDLFESTGISETKTPGGRAESAKTFTGKFVDRNLELLQNDPTILDDIAKQGFGATPIFSEQLPLGLIPEHPIPHPNMPTPPRIDRLWRSGETIFELKPNTAAALKGEVQAQQYAAWMDRFGEPLPGGRKWQFRVVTYDQARLMGYLRSRGVLP
jgi:hypothetical protein